MKETERNSLYLKAIKKWGTRSQIEMLQEEATELALAARKFIREDNFDNFKNLASEIADTEIMIEQLKLMFSGIEEILASEKDRKLYRLQDTLNK